ncbi:MAG: helix-hairpin-helix domain-containing protein [bacterium]
MLVVPLIAAAFGAALPALPIDLTPNADDEHVREAAEALRARPIDLNRAGVEELLEIPWLDPVLAWRIVGWRDSVGGFSSTTELGRVPGLTPDWLRLVLPFVRVGPVQSPAGGSARLSLRADTMPPGGRWSGSAAASIERGPWSAALAAENDAGEPILPDWLGGSLAYESGATRACAGDFTFGSGLGLVFSGPHRRFADRAGRSPDGPSSMRALRLPLEARHLRGLAVERRFGEFTLAGFGSWAGRDAVLGADGEPRRIRLDGRNSDSTRLAGRRAVDEKSVGARAGFERAGFRLALTLGHLDYEPGIAPADSHWSFFGRSLTFGGAGLDWLGRPYRLAAEAAGSTGGGWAGAATVEGNWDRFRLALGADARTAGFFAPLGRWQSTTDRRDRFSGRVSARWTPGALSVSASASSLQDYVTDSLPGRAGLDIGLPIGPVRLTMGVERRYRLDEPSFRRAHAELRWQALPVLGLGLEFDDGYPEGTAGHGRAAAVRVETGVGRVSLRAAAARFDVAGSARMYFTDPMVFGPALSYSTARTGWRIGAAAGARLAFGRFGLSAGWSPGVEAGWNAATWLETGR